MKRRTQMLQRLTMKGAMTATVSHRFFLPERVIV
jgi:hypothetical protein